MRTASASGRNLTFIDLEPNIIQSNCEERWNSLTMWAKDGADSSERPNVSLEESESETIVGGRDSGGKMFCKSDLGSEISLPSRHTAKFSVNSARGGGSPRCQFEEVAPKHTLLITSWRSIGNQVG
jgi:hypothetical protein